MSDYSEKYVEDKRGYIFIGGSNEIVKFKPFVKNLNYDLKFNDISVEAGSFTEIKLQHSFKTQEYNISFDVVAVDAPEAIENHNGFWRAPQKPKGSQEKFRSSPTAVEAG